MTTFNTDAVRRAVLQKSGGMRRAGKEENLPIYIAGTRVTRVTVPRGHGDLDPGTAKSIQNQLRLTSGDFGRFVGCALTGPEYEQLLIQKHIAGEL